MNNIQNMNGNLIEHEIDLLEHNKNGGHIPLVIMYYHAETATVRI